MNDNRCTLPFDGHSLIFLDQNLVSTCCSVAPVQIDSNTGIITKELQELRRAVINNERSQQCASCWKIDDAGGPSYRRRASRHFKEEINWSELSETQPVPSIQISFSNKCQMMCVYCSPSVSSMWQSAQDDFAQLKEVKFYPSKTKRRVEDIVNIGELKTIMVTGGEPMLEQDCIEFLQDLPVDDTRQMSIVTNLSYGQATLNILLEIIERHQNVNIACSLDAVGENVTRKYMNWALWERNFNVLVDNLQQRRKKYKNAYLMIKPTFGIFNYHKIQELIEYAISFRKAGKYGITFDINPLYNDTIGSLASGTIDPNIRIKLSDADLKLLSVRELGFIEMANSLLDNSVCNTNMKQRTEDFFKSYLNY